MLNKLLKRCMPWMARGRWYQIGIKMIPGEGPKVFGDPIFTNLTLETNYVTFEINEIKNIIDYKFIPADGFGRIIPPSDFPFSEDDFGFRLTFPYSGTYWLFMR